MLKKIFYPVLLCSFISAPVLADLQKDMQVLANSVDVIESDSNVDSGVRLENGKYPTLSLLFELA
ncbi:hypothetical protein ICB99_004215 [Salmonella enterica]|nr:hypothetical protein [Salmonella enterica]